MSNGKEVGSAQQEIDSIDDKLKELNERKAEIQNQNHDNDSAKKVSFSTSQKTAPLESNATTKVYYITPPPSTPAPKVILEAEDLPPCPCRTQCPECRQFVVTETSQSVSSVTWMVCFMTAMIGCVAGCCLIPFCLESFKSTTHKCPRCRSVISTVKKL
ncbi:lipopolysaccharide-induced tumor necrosis factor-alpha factor homolog [Limanda limanda]|uniref:lipopolysaccharide-induced tumor necrosis factor-alpha factor homolog n=1 Tax=Limanda limanda TaxID=27771 RepID=UPI0029C94182|nr:lipopolysaccharide-induced tumor necrosis factor-alpha factor homolog [Limanda limanda]